jgi:hypothetical protein
MISRLKFVVVLFLILLFAGGAFAQAPLIASSAPIPLSLVGTETLTVVCTPTAGVTFAAAAGTTVNGSVPISCLTTWNLHSTRTSLTLFAGVANAASALTDGTNLIPSSSLSASYAGGAANPCSATLTAATPIGAGGACGTTGTGNLLTNNFNSTNTTAITLTLAEPATLSANTHTGSLLISVVAI